jgi:hypothetical protein
MYAAAKSAAAAAPRSAAAAARQAQRGGARRGARTQDLVAPLLQVALHAWRGFVGAEREKHVHAARVSGLLAGDLHRAAAFGIQRVHIQAEAKQLVEHPGLPCRGCHVYQRGVMVKDGARVRLVRQELLHGRGGTGSDGEEQRRGRALLGRRTLGRRSLLVSRCRWRAAARGLASVLASTIARPVSMRSVITGGWSARAAQ